MERARDLLKTESFGSADVMVFRLCSLNSYHSLHFLGWVFLYLAASSAYSTDSWMSDPSLGQLDFAFAITVPYIDDTPSAFVAAISCRLPAAGAIADLPVHSHSSHCNCCSSRSGTFDLGLLLSGVIETGLLIDALESRLGSTINSIACFPPCANEKESSATSE